MVSGGPLNIIFNLGAAKNVRSIYWSQNESIALASQLDAEDIVVKVGSNSDGTSNTACADYTATDIALTTSGFY
jgi:hypothetical protein